MFNPLGYSPLEQTRPEVPLSSGQTVDVQLPRCISATTPNLAPTPPSPAVETPRKATNVQSDRTATPSHTVAPPFSTPSNQPVVRLPPSTEPPVDKSKASIFLISASPPPPLPRKNRLPARSVSANFAPSSVLFDAALEMELQVVTGKGLTSALVLSALSKLPLIRRHWVLACFQAAAALLVSSCIEKMLLWGNI